ncbi:MAG: GTPase, partial [Planctomycetota bacterium]
MRPVVAIVGRPNVGKSSLLNKFVGRRVSIVDPTPGVTRDRVVTLLTLDAPTETPKGTPEIVVECMDTGGFGVYTAEGARFDDVGKDLAELTPDIEAQIARARQESDVILFVVDAQTGLTALDRTVARLIRQEGVADRVIVVSNKVDGPNWEAPGLEASALGLGDPTLCSTTNGHGM